MAANFESGVTYGERSWHGEETNLKATDDRRFSVSETLEVSGMNWRVAKYPLAIAPGHGDITSTPAPLSYGVFRTDTWGQVGSVTNAYEVLQNEEIFAQFQPFADVKALAFESAGSLDGGRKVYVQARLNQEDTDLGGGDLVRPYLLIAGSHDKSLATHIGFTPQRVVCENTLVAALNHGQTSCLRVRHRRGQKDAIKLIMETVDLARQQFTATCSVYTRLLQTPISRNDLTKYVKRVLDIAEDTEWSARLENQFDRMIQLALYGRGQSAGELTAWSAYNGVTQYITHERQRGAAAPKRFASNYFGTGQKLNRRALEAAVALAT